MSRCRRPVDGSAAEGQYAVVDRGLTYEGGHGEVPLPTYPAHGFVGVEGCSVLLDQVTEYEVVDGQELALTVLRSFGLISRNANPYREDPAGPEIPVPAAQLLGEREFTFALLPHRGDWRAADTVRHAEAYRYPMLRVRGLGLAEGGAACPARSTPPASAWTERRSPPCGGATAGSRSASSASTGARDRADRARRAWRAAGGGGGDGPAGPRRSPPRGRGTARSRCPWAPGRSGRSGCGSSPTAKRSVRPARIVRPARLSPRGRLLAVPDLLLAQRALQRFSRLSPLARASP